MRKHILVVLSLSILVFGTLFLTNQKPEYNKDKDKLAVASIQAETQRSAEKTASLPKLQDSFPTIKASKETQQKVEKYVNQFPYVDESLRSDLVKVRAIFEENKISKNHYFHFVEVLAFNSFSVGEMKTSMTPAISNDLMDKLTPLIKDFKSKRHSYERERALEHARSSKTALDFSRYQALQEDNPQEAVEYLWEHRFKEINHKTGVRASHKEANHKTW